MTKLEEMRGKAIKLKKLNTGKKGRYWTNCRECCQIGEGTTDKRDPIKCPVCSAIVCPFDEEDERN